MTVDLEGDAKRNLPAAVLAVMRETPDTEKPQYRQQVEAAVLKHDEKGAKRRPGSAQKRLRLLAYHELILFDQTGAAQGLAKSPAEAVVQLGELFQHTLRFDVAKDLVHRYSARWPRLLALKSLSSFMKELHGPCDGFNDDQKLDIQIARKSGATTTFVVFCGLAARFGQYLNIIHHCCMAKLDVNVVYLRDFSQLLYLTGVRSLGSLDESRDKLREMIAGLDTRRLVCMGNSGGVFGALYYGSILPADKVVVFSGPVSLQIGFEESERQAYQRLHALRAAGKVEWPDLRAIYAANKIPVDFYFGNQNRVDTAQAEILAGLPNVKLRPLQTKNHVLIDEMHRSRLFDKVLSDAAGAKNQSFVSRLKEAVGGVRGLSFGRGFSGK